MRLLRIGPAGGERPAVLDENDRAFDISAITGDIDAAFLNGQSSAGDGIGRVRAALAEGTLPPVDVTDARIGAPIANPGKIVCIGLNYFDHAQETGATPPTEPILFLKTPDTVVGPNDEVLIPHRSVKTDFEVELAVVIGRTARYLDSAQDALACVAGYAVVNDVSEREFQIERGGQWDKGKNCETFNPLGPWLVTEDEVPDPQALALKLWVNGEIRQDGSTGQMIFGVAEIIRYLSQFMVLRPGDVINTGTPAGVALGKPDPKPYLREGDVVELEITGLGKQRQSFGQAKP